MLSDNLLLESVADILGRDKSKIKKKVIRLRRRAMEIIHSKADFWWTRTGDSIALVAGNYQLDLRGYFPDFKRLSLLWTTSGMIDWMSEEEFRNLFPDDTASGVPVRYFHHEEDLIQIHPRNDTTRTIYITYVYLPKFNTIANMPSQWHHVVESFILAGFEKKDEFKYRNLFRDGLKEMVASAKPSQGEQGKILTPDFEITHYDEMLNDR